jgi:hypothetical protein
VDRLTVDDWPSGRVTESASGRMAEIARSYERVRHEAAKRVRVARNGMVTRLRLIFSFIVWSFFF